MKLLEERLPIDLVVAMVQREAAQRLCAKPGSKQSGAVTLAVNYHSDPSILFDVSPGSFYPVPKVSSSVIKLAVLKEPSAQPRDEAQMFRVIKAAFLQRRKTAANSISAGMSIDKALVTKALELIGAEPAVRPEQLTVIQFAKLSDTIIELGVRS